MQKFLLEQMINDAVDWMMAARKSHPALLPPTWAFEIFENRSQDKEEGAGTAGTAESMSLRCGVCGSIIKGRIGLCDCDLTLG